MNPQLPPNFVEGFSDEEKVRKMPYDFFGTTGLKISKLSLGGGAFGGSHTYGEYHQEKGAATVINAIRYGINFIDAGVHYGKGLAETFLGPVLKKIPRKAYLISTKVGRCGNHFDFSPKAVTESFEQSLKRLQLDYVDIVFVHDIEFADSLDFILNETLPAVHQFVESGRAKYIGVSGYPLTTLWEAVKNSRIKIDCVLTYCRDSLIDNSLQDFFPLFENKGVGVINAGCIGMRLLSNCGPLNWHPASKELKNLCCSAAQYCKENDVEFGQLALYHALNQPGSCTCLVGMNDPEFLKTNLNILWNGLSEKDLRVFRHLKDRYFKSDMKCHWEGIELELYRKNLL